MAENEKSIRKTFFSGVLLLSFSTVLVKLVGFLWKIPMLTLLGSVGMGYFHSAYEIYALFCIISTAGLPVSLSVLISGAVANRKYGEVKRIYHASLAVFLLIGVLGTLVMILAAPVFCRFIRSENALGCIRSISPTVFLVCLSSALRGYFQGYQKMLPTAISQLLEALGKLVFGVWFAKAALERGADTPQVAAAAGWGLSLGTLVSCLYLIAAKLRFPSTVETETAPGRQPNAPAELSETIPAYRDVWGNLSKLALPMTVGASAVSLTRLIDVTMILRRLQSIGYSELLANQAYGSYTTLALSVFALVPTLLGSVALPLVPLLSAAVTSGQKERQEEMILASYRLVAVVSIPAALGLGAFSYPILSLLFSSEPQAVATASPLLALLSASVFLSCMITATNSVLHAFRSVNKPLISFLLGAVVKILSAYFLIGSPAIGLRGAPISTFLCDAVVVGCNLHFANRHCRISGLFRLFLKPLLCSGIAVAFSGSLYLVLSQRIGDSPFLTLGILLLTAVLYLLLACGVGVLKKSDLKLLKKEKAKP